MFKDSAEGQTHFDPVVEAAAKVALSKAKCLRCGRQLKSQRAIKIGYGSFCQKLYNIKLVRLKPLFHISPAVNEPTINKNVKKRYKR